MKALPKAVLCYRSPTHHRYAHNESYICVLRLRRRPRSKSAFRVPFDASIIHNGGESGNYTLFRNPCGAPTMESRELRLSVQEKMVDVSKVLNLRGGKQYESTVLHFNRDSSLAAITYTWVIAPSKGTSTRKQYTHTPAISRTQFNEYLGRLAVDVRKIGHYTCPGVRREGTERWKIDTVSAFLKVLGFQNGAKW